MFTNDEFAQAEQIHVTDSQNKNLNITNTTEACLGPS